MLPESTMSVYNVYPLLSDLTTKKAAKSLPKKQRKIGKYELLGNMLGFSGMVHQTLDFFVMAEELLWESSKRNIIFPENEDVVKSLLRAKFSLSGEGHGINMPFGSFVLAMPKGFKQEGIDIPSALITWARFSDYKDNIITPFCNAISYPAPESVKSAVDNPDNFSIAICYPDPYAERSIGNFMRGRVTIMADDIPDVLEAKNSDEFVSRVGTYRDSTLQAVIDSEPHDIVIQFTLLRLVIAMGVYNAATNGERLIAGTPGNVSRMTLVGSKNKAPMQATTLTAPKKETKSTHGEQETHYRTWTFRQLRHPKYYQGEHAKVAPGTRWVFVSDTIVKGREATPYTQTIQ